MTSASRALLLISVVGVLLVKASRPANGLLEIGRGHAGLPAALEGLLKTSAAAVKTDDDPRNATRAFGTIVPSAANGTGYSDQEHEQGQGQGREQAYEVDDHDELCEDNEDEATWSPVEGRPHLLHNVELGRWRDRYRGQTFEEDPGNKLYCSRRGCSCFYDTVTAMFDTTLCNLHATVCIDEELVPFGQQDGHTNNCPGLRQCRIGGSHRTTTCQSLALHHFVAKCCDSRSPPNGIANLCLDGACVTTLQPAASAGPLSLGGGADLQRTQLFRSLRTGARGRTERQGWRRRRLRARPAASRLPAAARPNCTRAASPPRRVRPLPRR
eukprot:SAG31_NODE_9758_length_1231_cov_3.703180_2_plen_326_part_01